MSATKDIATHVESWAAEVTDASTFPENPGDLDATLPIVVCDVLSRRRRETDGDFSAYETEHTSLRLWALRLTVMVAPEPEHTRAQELYDLTDELERALLRDRSLGGRVELSSPVLDVEYPGELEHPSGSVVLGAYLSITIGELTTEAT